MLLITLLTQTNLWAQSSTDNFIDPATQTDYSKVWEEKIQPKAEMIEMVIEKCKMFSIQGDMAVLGNEQSMSPKEIDSYEKMIESRCVCEQNQHTWVPAAGADTNPILGGTCDSSKTDEKKPDLFEYTLALCMTQTGRTNEDAKQCFSQNDAGEKKDADAAQKDNCMANFRYQCFQYITRIKEFYEPTKIAAERLGRCTWEDQTKIIKMSCRSWCYQKQVCKIGDNNDGTSITEVGGKSDEEKKEMLDSFSKRKIGNIYLMNQISRSSCVKDSSFGLESDNSIWVNNSCYGDFGLQFKDPDCGFRPTCPIPVHAIENDNKKKEGVALLECNGQSSQIDPATNKLKRMFCKLWPTKEDGTASTPVAKDAERDGDKLVTYINTVDLQERIAGTCNPGGNNSQRDFAPMNMSDLNPDSVGQGSGSGKATDQNSGWGIYVENGCHGIFKVSYKWEIANCLKAGEVAGTGGAQNCCLGTVEAETADGKKYCQSPIIVDEVPRLTDPEQLGIAKGQRSCEKVIIESVKARANGYMKEIALYENFFAILDNKDDKITALKKGTGIEIGALDKAKVDGDQYPKPHESQYDVLSDVHNAFVNFRSGYNDIIRDWNKANKKLEKDYEFFGKNVQLVDTQKKTSTQILKERPDIDTIFLAKDASGKILLDNNKLPSLASTQFVAKNLQLDGAIRDQAVTLAIAERFKMLEEELWEAVEKSANIVWLCAHSDNCSGKNWLTQDATREKIIEYFHDPQHAYLADDIQNVLKFRQILPNLTGKHAKYLVANETINGAGSFGKWLVTYPPYRQYFDFEKALLMELPPSEDPTKVENDLWRIFLQYTLEVPLREDSLFKDDPYFAAYAQDYKKGRGKDKANEYKFGKDNSRKIPLPYYCEKMQETEQMEAFAVRIPIGKLIEVIRAYQLAGYFYDYYTKYYLAIYDEKIQCLTEVNRTGGSDSFGADTKGLGAPDGVKGSGTQLPAPLSDATGNLFGTFSANLPGFGASASLLAGNKDKGSVANVKSNNSGLDGTGLTGAASRKGKKAGLDRDSVLRFAKRRGDTIIPKHIDSLKTSLAQAFSMRAPLTSAAVAAVGANTGSSNANSVLNSANVTGKEDTTFQDKLKGQGSFNSNSSRGGGGGGGRSSDSGGGFDSGSSSSNSSGSSSMDEGMMRDINDPRFNPNPDDTLWQSVTKRYIRSGYPVLLKK